MARLPDSVLGPVFETEEEVLAYAAEMEAKYKLIQDMTPAERAEFFANHQGSNIEDIE